MDKEKIRTTIILPKALWDSVKKEAENKMLTPSAIIRIILAEYLNFNNKEVKNESANSK